MSNVNGQTLKGVARLVSNEVLSQHLTLISSSLDGDSADKVLEKISDAANKALESARSEISDTATKTKDELLESTRTEIDNLKVQILNETNKAKEDALELTLKELDALKLQVSTVGEVKHSAEEVAAPGAEDLPSALLELNALAVDLKQPDNKLLFRVNADDLAPFIKVSEDGGYSVQLEQLVMWQHLALKEQLAKYSEIVHRLLVLENFISGLVAKK